VDVAPPGAVAAAVAEVRSALGAAVAGAGVLGGVPAGARGAVAMPLVASEAQVSGSPGQTPRRRGLCPHRRNMQRLPLVACDAQVRDDVWQSSLLGRTC